MTIEQMAKGKTRNNDLYPTHTELDGTVGTRLDRQTHALSRKPQCTSKASSKFYRSLALAVRLQD